LPAALPSLVDTYGAASSALAAEWYLAARDQAQVPGRFTPLPARIADTGIPELVGWAVGSAFNLDGALTLVSGGVSRRVQNFGRTTIVDSSFADPGAEGWIRVGLPSHCSWCDQYLDGEVHYVEGYGFNAHDHCHCQAVPAFAGRPRLGHLLAA
jgi:hypothetical protein